MIGLSSSYFAFKGKNIRPAVEEIFNLGFDVAELGAAHNFEENIEATLKQLASDFPEKSFTLHGLFPPQQKHFWFNTALGLNEENRAVVDGLFNAASIVEAKCIGVHPGYACKVGWGEVKRGMSYPKVIEEIPKQEAWQNSLAVLEYAVQLSEQTGLRFAIENICEPRVPLVIEEKEHFDQLFRQFPKLGLLLDLGHAMFKGNLSEMLQLSNRIFEAHIHRSQCISTGAEEDQHMPISEADLEPLEGLSVLKDVPLVFEHGLNVSEGEIIDERKLLESFLSKL